MSHPYTVIIPARYQSTRLPGKPLKYIGDKTLIQHVCSCASQSNAANVVVATDDNRIAEHVTASGFNVVMTSVDCHSGTDRIAQAVEELGLSDNCVVVNLQGDEPFMHAAVINQMADKLIDTPEAAISTGCELLKCEDDYANPNIVKVVRDKNGLALYFSRSFIPYSPDPHPGGVFKHLGIYAYTAGYVKQFAALAPCALETSEKLEQLRALWQGDRIIVSEVTTTTGIGVDTPEDLALARHFYAKQHEN